MDVPEASLDQCVAQVVRAFRTMDSPCQDDLRAALRAIKLLNATIDKVHEERNIVARQRDEARANITTVQTWFSRFMEDVATAAGMHAPHVATLDDVEEEVARVHSVAVEYQLRRNQLFALAADWDKEGDRLLGLAAQSRDPHHRDRLETVAGTFFTNAVALRTTLDLDVAKDVR